MCAFSSVAPVLSSAASRDEPTATGTLAGTVRLGPWLSQRRKRVSLYPELRPAAAPEGDRRVEAELTNVVIYLENAPALQDSRPAPSGPFRMQQVGESFVPHVLPVVAGSTVEFVNGDPIYHNVFSLSKAASFDLGRFPRGSSRSVRFDEPGIIKVFCHIHSDMSAVIFVLDHRYFAMPDAEGRFTMPGIPAGRYTVTGWHERARPIRREVTIEPSGRAEISLAIPIEDEAHEQ
jgi:plastocyanin